MLSSPGRKRIQRPCRLTRPRRSLSHRWPVAARLLLRGLVQCWMTEAVSSSCHFVCFKNERCSWIVFSSFLLPRSGVTLVSLRKTKIYIHIHMQYIYIHMYTGKKREGKRWIHCVLRLSPPGPFLERIPTLRVTWSTCWRPKPGNHNRIANLL